MTLTFYIFVIASVLFAAVTPAQGDRTVFTSLALKERPSHENLDNHVSFLRNISRLWCAVISRSYYSFPWIFKLSAKAFYWTTRKTLDQANEVPWRCFAKNETGQVCSCTIISKNFVLAKSTCVQGAQGSIQVHVGASNKTNAEQIVGASLLEASEPAPPGIVGIKLAAELKFSSRVSRIKWILQIISFLLAPVKSILFLDIFVSGNLFAGFQHQDDKSRTWQPFWNCVGLRVQKWHLWARSFWSSRIWN